MENEKFEIEPSSPLESDKLVEIAAQAEKRIEAVNKIKTMALRLTNYHDWTDQGGKPYLQVSGAEKIARLFGISWRFTTDKIQRLDEEGGHFSYQCTMEFVMSGASVEFQGSRSSKDPFFSKKYGKDIPPQEIDKMDVMKASITNTIGNGITRLLGIRNLTWEDLKGAKIDIDRIGKVEYKNGKKKNQEPDKPLDTTNHDKPDAQDAPGQEKKTDPIPDHSLISEPQRKRFYAIAKSTNATDDQIKEWLFREYDIEHSKDIPKNLYDEICTRVKGDLSDPGSEG